MKRLSMVKKDDISLSDLFEKFIKKCKVKNLSDYSIRFYQSGYRMFTQFIDEDTQLEEITANTIDNYILYLRENSKANGITINSYLRGIRAVLYYGMNNNNLEQFTIHTPKVEKKIKETYTDAELKILLKKPNLKTMMIVEEQEIYFIWEEKSFE